MSGKNSTEAHHQFPTAGRSTGGFGAWLTPGVFANSLNAMLITDDDRVYRDCNRAAELLLDCSRDEIVGSRIEDFTSVELRDQVSAAWGAFLEAGAGEGIWELVTPSGKRIDVEYSATANVAPGRHLSIFMAATDPLVSPGAGAHQEAKPLSPREREIMARIAWGASGQQIATELFISPETVRTHLRNILLKLGAQTRPHAVALALQRGEIMAQEAMPGAVTLGQRGSIGAISDASGPQS